MITVKLKNQRLGKGKSPQAAYHSYSVAVHVTDSGRTAYTP